jgi:diguanylate cyclase (GGDEF)-like protein
MKNNKTLEIIRLCLKIDQMAGELYHRFSLSSKQEDLRQFWHRMSQEEDMHVKFWSRTIAIAENWALPKIFDHPEKVIDEFTAIIPKAEDILKKSQKQDCIASAFLAAYRLEFYLLHPAVAILFHLLRDSVGLPNPEDEYEAHINGFIEALAKYGEITPELELLGETLKRLWGENRSLAKQAARDSLTGILNRRGFFAIASHLAYLSQRQQGNVSAAMLDIDHFKHINDTHGHHVGDQVLVTIAQIIETEIRHADLAGRFGGEEFIIMMPDTDLNAAVRVTERIRKAVAEAKPDNVEVSLSAGIAAGKISANVINDLQQLIKQADDNLYRAKEAGRNRVCY